MSKEFGPDRRETRIYLWVSLAGLALLAVALVLRGADTIVAVEIALMAGAFFGGTVIWALRRLWRLK